jgi:hypothetical protein
MRFCKQLKRLAEMNEKLKAELQKMLKKHSPLSRDDKERIRAVLADMV